MSNDGWYILNPDHSIKEVDIDEGIKQFKDIKARRVAVTDLVKGKTWVSTVFLGLNHRFFDKGPPILFETLVFSDIEDVNNRMERYCTWDEAVKGHNRIVNETRVNLGIKIHREEPRRLRFRG